MSNKIKNVREVLKQYTGSKKKIVDIKIAPLTAPGENYSAVLYKLDVALKTEDDKEEKLYAVAKLVPAIEKMKMMCDIQVSVRKEIAMFNTITPLLQELQKENGVKDIVDYLPKLYATRLNLDGTDDFVDDDSVIIMENLQASGYVNVDRMVGLNLEETKSILAELAAFHALPIALKIKKPEVFQTKVKPFLTPHKPPMKKPTKKEDSHESQGATHDSLILEVLEDDPKCIPYIPKLKKLISATDFFNYIAPKEPFASISHGDLWINNAMVKFDGNKPVKSKLIDFQFYDYKSPARDLFFFLFTSVQNKVLEEHLDDLVKFYHNHFVSRLKEVHCDTNLFSFDHFLEELRESAKLEFKRALVFALFVVTRNKPMSPGFYPGKPRDISKLRGDISSDAKRNVRFMVYLCGKKGWL